MISLKTNIRFNKSLCHIANSNQGHKQFVTSGHVLEPTESINVSPVNCSTLGHSFPINQIFHFHV